MASHKIARIAADISRNISEILATEARDDLLKTITITGCTVTNDLSFCKVYFTSLSSLPKDSLGILLNLNSSMMSLLLMEKKMKK